MDTEVELSTAGGITTTRESIVMTPFGKQDPVEALVLPDSPALLSLGRLCVEEGCGFVWEPGQKSQLKLPTGRTVCLDVVNRVPVLPMRGASCPAQAGGSMASSGPAPPAGEMEDEESAPEHADDAKGDLSPVPPDHYLTHFPKHPKCEMCQATKMQHRQCRKRKDDQDKDQSYSAKEFGDVVTVDHVSAEAGLSTKGDGYAIVVKDLFTGWLECYPTGTKSEEDAVEALLCWAA